MKHIKIYEQFDEWDPFGEELKSPRMNTIEEILVELFGKYYKIEIAVADNYLIRIMEGPIVVENNYRALYFKDWDKHILYFFSNIERKLFHDRLKNRIGAVNGFASSKDYTFLNNQIHKKVFVLTIYK